MDNIIAFPFARTLEGRGIAANLAGKEYDAGLIARVVDSSADLPEGVDPTKNAEYEAWAIDRSSQGKYVPAYCDPKNESKGDKYKEFGNLDVAEVAKRVRAEIKAKIKSGDFPAGLKVSVRVKRYSGGASVDADIKAGLGQINPAYVEAYNRSIAQGQNDYNACQIARNQEGYWLDDAGKIIEEIKAMGEAYRRDNSDSMSDYFDCNFYYFCSVDWEYDMELKKAAGLGGY